MGGVCVLLQAADLIKEDQKRKTPAVNPGVNGRNGTLGVVRHMPLPDLESKKV